MTKADIIERIHRGTGRTRKHSSGIFESVITIMKNVLESGEDVKIERFGKFVIREKSDRDGRNPLTGEAVTIKARRVTTFKASPILVAEINRQI